MSNDLIFSILPRNTKVPIETDNRVKKVARSEKSEALNQDEKEQHDEVHIVDEMEQREPSRGVLQVLPPFGHFPYLRHAVDRDQHQ